MSTDTAAATRTPAEWEALALSFEADTIANRKAAQDSFDRCDTDGFLSQWASDSTARLNTAKAQWARDHGRVAVRVLLNTDGTVASTHEHEGRYGMCWVLNDAAARFGKRFFSPSKCQRYDRQAAANRRKGFVEALAMVEGYVKLDGSGHGMSGAMTVAPRGFPNIDALKAGQFEITDPDQLMTLSGMWDDYVHPGAAQ